MLTASCDQKAARSTDGDRKSNIHYRNIQLVVIDDAASDDSIISAANIDDDDAQICKARPK